MMFSTEVVMAEIEAAIWNEVPGEYAALAVNAVADIVEPVCARLGELLALEAAARRDPCVRKVQ